MFSGGIFSTTIGILFAMWLFYWRPERKKRKEQERKDKRELEYYEECRRQIKENMENSKKEFEADNAPDFLTATDTDIKSYLIKKKDHSVILNYFRVSEYLGRKLSDSLKDEIDKIYYHSKFN